MKSISKRLFSMDRKQTRRMNCGTETKEISCNPRAKRNPTHNVILNHRLIKWSDSRRFLMKTSLNAQLMKPFSRMNNKNFMRRRRNADVEQKHDGQGLLDIDAWGAEPVKSPVARLELLWKRWNDGEILHDWIHVTCMKLTQWPVDHSLAHLLPLLTHFFAPQLALRSPALVRSITRSSM